MRQQESESVSAQLEGVEWRVFGFSVELWGKESRKFWRDAGGEREWFGGVRLTNVPACRTLVITRCDQSASPGASGCTSAVAVWGLGTGRVVGARFGDGCSWDVRCLA